MQGTLARGRSSVSAKLGWVLALALLVPGACGGDLAINFESDGSEDTGSGGSAGAGGKSSAGEGGETVGGQDGSSAGAGGENDGSGGAIAQSGGSAGKGGAVGQGGGSSGGSGGNSGGSGGNSGGSGGASGSGGGASCGNGELDDGEDCDDENVTSGDGCSSECTDACELCMAANCVENTEPIAPYCFSMPGTGTKGAGAGIAKGKLCGDMVDCVQREGCYDAASGVSPCFCGDATGSKCTAEGVDGPNGACYDEIFAAVEGVANVDFLSYGTDVLYPSGYATILLGCTYSLCHDECFAK